MAYEESFTILLIAKLKRSKFTLYINLKASSIDDCDNILLIHLHVWVSLWVTNKYKVCKVAKPITQVFNVNTLTFYFLVHKSTTFP